MNNIDNFLINLNSVSNIKGHKFYVNEEKLIILRKDDLFFSLYRFYYNIDRKKNLDDLILIYNEIFAYINKLLSSNINLNCYHELDNNISENSLTIYNNLDTSSIDNCKQLIDLKNALKQSISGLENLKLIYNNCNISHSKINILINNINGHLYKINKKIHINTKIKSY